MYTYKYTPTATIIYIYIYVCVYVTEDTHAWHVTTVGQKTSQNQRLSTSVLAMTACNTRQKHEQIIA